MKRMFTLSMAVLMVLALAACGGGNTEPDVAYVQDKGTLVVGITEFEPMDYRDADGNWIGFDADMAAAFAESLGVEVEFRLINWDNKVTELNNKTIDVVWNGMTLTDDVTSQMSCSRPYFNNAQVVIVKANAANLYQTVESVKNLNFAVEDGSAGMDQVAILGAVYTPVADQATALMEVADGTADAAVIDYLMAAATVGEGTAYPELTYTCELNAEEYGVGFRQGSDLTERLNDFFFKAYDNGTMQAIADTYGIGDKLISQH